MDFLRLAGLLLVLAALAHGQDECTSIADPDKLDCGYSGIDQTQCEAKDCCWIPVREGEARDTPWCFFKEDSVCYNIQWGGSGPGFTQTDIDIMYDNYKYNLNVDGSGAVVASRDPDTPGGSYYYHWMRDAGLSMKAWIEINNNDLNAIRTEMDAYVDWVGIVQNKPDANVDVRVEPKFYIPSGDPYDGGWCRPQTDGPALRAMALSKYGDLLYDNGENVDTLYGRVKFDLEWVESNWQSEGCDLWEEVRSDDFYFNRAAYVYSLNIAADFSDKIGQSDGSRWRSLANQIKPTAEAHYYTNDYIYESTNREQDGAVIHSIATFGEYLYGVTSQEAADTIDKLSKTFCAIFPINVNTVTSGLPGVLIGRYPGDSYDGGNPWQLLTAVLGEVFYLGAQANFKAVKEAGHSPLLTEEEHGSWIRLLKMEEGSTLADLAAKQISAGDAVMNL